MGGVDGGGGLRFEPRPLVPVCVTFSKYVFGQVEADELQPPKAYLTAITDVMTMGGGREGEMGEKKKEEDRGRDRMKAAVARGVRLACGLEMLYWRSKQGEERGREGGQKGWKAYLARLRGKGFWGGVVEGSKEYKERMTQAQKAFQQTRTSSYHSGGGGGGEGGGGGKEMCEIIDEVLLKEEGKLKVEDISKALSELPADDGEEWMEMVPGELDRLLEKYGQPLEGEEEEGGIFFNDGDDDDDEEEEEEEEEEKEEGRREGGGEDLKSMVEGMKHFIGAMAGLEGAEVPGGRGMSSSNDSSGFRVTKKGEDVSFDVSRLLDILEGRDTERTSRAGVMVGRMEGGVDSNDKEDGEEEDQRGDRSKGRMYMREVNVKSWNGRDSDDEDESDEEEEEDEREREKEEKGVMEAYMAQMERELKGTTLAKTFDRVPCAAQGACADGDSEKRDKHEKLREDVDEDEELPPVDVDLNLVRHLLESVAAQGSLPGPASNMLGEVMKSMGAE